MYYCCFYSLEILLPLSTSQFSIFECLHCSTPIFAFFLLSIFFPPHPVINFSRSPCTTLRSLFYDLVILMSPPLIFLDFLPHLISRILVSRGSLSRFTKRRRRRVVQREHGTYLRADIRGARGFSSGGETHWTLGKAKASESSRRQPSSAPSLTRNRRNRSVPSAPSSAAVIFDPRDALSLPLRCSRYSADFLAITGKSHPHIISENLVYDSNH